MYRFFEKYNIKINKYLIKIDKHDKITYKLTNLCVKMMKLTNKKLIILQKDEKKKHYSLSQSIIKKKNIYYKYSSNFGLSRTQVIKILYNNITHVTLRSTVRLFYVLYESSTSSAKEQKCPIYPQ